MDKPRILFVVPLPPPVHGSSAVCQVIRKSMHVRQSFQCDFVNLSTSRRMEEIGNRSWWKVFRFIGAYGQVFIRLLFHHYDACYLAITCYGLGFLKDVPFVALCKLFGKKVILHQHNKGMSRYVFRWPYRWLLPWVYCGTKVMLLSERLYPDVSKVVRQEQIYICPNGIPLISQISAFSESDIPHMLFLSNLIPSKGVYILLDACLLLKNREMRFVCDVVGGETKYINRFLFEQEIRLRNLEDVVFYHGPRYGAEKERFLNQADIFIQPTFEDCFPLSILEAMQHGLPVVSTDEGAIPDMVIDGETGFVCKRKNVESFANALEKILNNKDLRKQMGLKGCLRYKERYTLEVFEKNFCGILSDILK